MVGNHLLQHRELSATAIGVGAYIQSLPEGAPVGIRVLTDHFPEGEIRISAALRELEQHGYLERRRERQGTGRVVTRTYSYNKPLTTPDEPPPPPDPEPVPDPEPEPQRVADPDPEPAPQPVHPGAADLLANLRRYDPRLLLAERDVQRLAPGVSAWLERGADPEAIGLALTANLPEPMRSPASVLAYRLEVLLPPHLPAAPSTSPIRRPDPFQTCDGCDRAFRSPHPGRCRDCPPPPEVRAAA
ncbi:helix-turn-helix domain-containing protein [Streptomyces sp. NPDC090741]|uniref:helix-turn-helix domain-containing protein n=1 Tax=Streptomyces sp. NPDC090741 TaxID=3365967 RepID=UPI00380274C0